MTTHHRTVTLIILAVVVAAGLATGCSDSSPADPSTASPAQTTATSSSQVSASPAATKKDLRVSGAYLPQPPMKDMAALYFTVHNTGAQPDHLNRVRVPGLSDHVTTHTVRDDEMVHVNGYRVPAHGRLVLRRGGKHIMLMNLTHIPKPGSTVQVRLFFDRAGTLTLTVPVVAATYQPSPSAAPNQ